MKWKSWYGRVTTPFRIPWMLMLNWFKIVCMILNRIQWLDINIFAVAVLAPSRADSGTYKWGSNSAGRQANSGTYKMGSSSAGRQTVTSFLYVPKDQTHFLREILQPKLGFHSMSLCDSDFITSNGFWCMGIKGEMSGTVCVTFTWYMYIYELLIAFVCFVVCSLL